MDSCKKCGKEFTNYRTLAAHSVTCIHYPEKEVCEICGKNMFSIYMGVHKNWHKKNDKKCKNCGKITFGDRIFCSRSCSAIYNNLGSRKSSEKLKRHSCKNCGEPVKNQNVFCSHKCSCEHKRGGYIDQWISGEIKGETKGGKPSSKIKKYFVEKFDNKCQLCGWGELNEHTGIVPLNLHHMDGNWRNNRPENLQLLCPNCHSLTNNYGGRNKGNGRPQRTEWRNKTRSDPDGKGSVFQTDN